MSGKNRVLVVAAHPDDEVLGCGGTVARHADAGDDIHILIMAEGATSRTTAGAENVDYTEDLKALRSAAAEAANILGARQPVFAEFPDNRMDTAPLLDVTQRIEQTVVETKPNIVYTHHGGDLNVDHRVVHQAVLTACRPLPDSPVRAIYTFETVSSTEWSSPEDAAGPFRPTRFVDISGQLERKLSALGAYEMEMRAHPHARSTENVSALATHRGASAGLTAAEAFIVLRKVIQ
jgi:LmbE family N-acetylglucosaminyl deacetylase